MTNHEMSALLRTDRMLGHEHAADAAFVALTLMLNRPTAPIALRRYIVDAHTLQCWATAMLACAWLQALTGACT